MRLLAVFVVLVLPASSASFSTMVVVDGQTHCVSVPDIHASWVEVSVGAGAHTFTLVDSDFGSSPGAQNHMVFVYGDQLDPSSYDFWFFSLNSVGDFRDVTFLSGGRVFLGFIDTGVSDNEGGSLVQVSGLAEPVYVDGVANCTEVPGLLDGFLEFPGCGPELYYLELYNSEYGSSPGATNRMVFVLCDQLEPSFSDFWFFTLNASDMIPVCTMWNDRLFFGFVDADCSDNHGTTTVRVQAECISPVSSEGWGSIKALFRGQ